MEEENEKEERAKKIQETKDKIKTFSSALGTKAKTSGQNLINKVKLTNLRLKEKIFATVCSNLPQTSFF